MTKETLTISDIKRFAMDSLSSCRGSHDWHHTLRVFHLCLHIGNVEGADREVLKVAAYLHDVGRPFQDESEGRICHAEKGAEIATGLVEKLSLSGGQKANIIHSIRTHRFRGNQKPQTLEAKVLFDADKLDSIGAVGIGRTFHFAGKVGAKLHNPSISPEETRPYTEEDTAYREFCMKLIKIKDRMLTFTGYQIAIERHKLMEAFFERFLREYERF